MGQYKVPQDVEAEDKLVGFLTLKQFIYVIIGLAWGFLSFQLLKALPFIFVIVGIPPAAIMLMLGLIQRQGQPFETYFLALISFYFKPRRRLWHKDPIVEVFKLEAPKITNDQNQRNPEEVRSQLERIGEIVDTRGWAAKEPEIQEPSLSAVVSHDDRIASFELPAAPVAEGDIELTDDILDFTHNPNAANLNELIEDAVKNVRSEAMEKMKNPPATAAKSSVSEMTSNPVAGILKLAMENEELTVSQLAAQAQKHVAINEGQVVNLRGSATSPQQPNQ